MTFSELSLYFQKLEETSLRNKMVEILAGLFERADVSDIDKICYLTQGRVAPLYEPVEFGISDKLMIRAIGRAYGVRDEEVKRLFGKLGDLGKVAEEVQSAKRKVQSQSAKLKVGDVFGKLGEVAEAAGAGSQERKLSLIADLLRGSDPLSVRYAVRITLDKLRLEFSDMTVLDALSWMVAGDKSKRGEVEEAYNVRPDLGYIARTLKEKGVFGLRRVEPKVGTPILMARAERLVTAEEVIAKIGRCAVEPKIDGFRVAVHYAERKVQSAKRKAGNEVEKGRTVTLFSRNMENTTEMFPDIVRGVIKQVGCREAIFEGEAVAYNPVTKEYLPFQETVQRKRKYDIEKVAKDIPLRLFCFDCLYVDGKSLLGEPYEKRRGFLREIIKKGEALSLMEEHIVEDAKELEKIFNEAVSRGLEGVMAKRLDGVYQAGARNFNWIKLKRSYESRLEDTIDAVIMGYDFGQGKRASFGIGGFLIGVYDKKPDTFKTIAKIGTGLTDEEWRELKVQSAKCKANDKPARYDVDKLMNCDVWVEPKMMVVVKADEITRSPVHTAGKSDDNMGYALRFPRLVDFRDDKSPEDATTVSEIIEMFKMQGKVKEKKGVST